MLPPEAQTCPWRLPGQYEDAETGLYYNRHRHYDPLTGQYSSPDPIGLAGGDRPQAYVERPHCWTDVLGLAAQVGAVKDANFAQNNVIKPTKSFSLPGQDKYTKAAGRPIKTVGDLTKALYDGTLTPSQVPVDYVRINGTILITNTRTSTALKNAGVPKSQWSGVDKTGRSVEGMPGTTFDDLARN